MSADLLYGVDDDSSWLAHIDALGRSWGSQASSLARHRSVLNSTTPLENVRIFDHANPTGDRDTMIRASYMSGEELTWWAVPRPAAEMFASLVSSAGTVTYLYGAPVAHLEGWAVRHILMSQDGSLRELTFIAAMLG